MTLYIGDTAVSPVVEVPVPEKKYGVSIDSILGNIDENGVYRFPTEPFTPDFSKAKQLPWYAWYYKFYKSGASGDLVFGLEAINLNSMSDAFEGCTGITSVSFPALVRVSESGGFSYAFKGCTGITSVSFPVLDRISAPRSMNEMFYGCTSLTSVSFPALTTISGSNAMQSAFYGCTSLTSVSFPALATVSGSNAFGSSSYNYIFAGCTALTEIHFRADAQAAIEAMTGYANKWGATNATIYFDL